MARPTARQQGCCRSSPPAKRVDKTKGLLHPALCDTLNNMTKMPKPGPRRKGSGGDCAIPPPIPAKELAGLVLPRNDDEVHRIADYVEWQAEGETVLHAEKVSSEHVMGRKHECWDVRTSKERYWVITSPTNLYTHKLFPSLDHTISFHIGVAARMASKSEPA